MKTAICILLLAAISCNTVEKDHLPDATSSVMALPVSFKWQPGISPDGKWKLIPALPADTATGRIPFLNFIMDSNRITGNTGCNNFSGTFNIDKTSLTFNHDFVSTKMTCAGYDEKAFERNLLRTNNFEIHGDTLVLMVNQTPLSYWKKVK